MERRSSSHSVEPFVKFFRFHKSVLSALTFANGVCGYNPDLLPLRYVTMPDQYVPGCPRGCVIL